MARYDEYSEDIVMIGTTEENNFAGADSLIFSRDLGKDIKDPLSKRR